MKDSLIIRCAGCGAGNRVQSQRLHLQPVCGRCGALLPPPWTKPVHVTDSTIHDEVFDSPLPVLADFWSPTCGPCHMLAPVMDQIARDLAGKLKVCKINVDESRGSAGHFGIMAVPTMILFKGMQILERIEGAQPKESIMLIIARFLHWYA